MPVIMAAFEDKTGVPPYWLDAMPQNGPAEPTPTPMPWDATGINVDGTWDDLMLGLLQEIAIFIRYLLDIYVL